MPRTEAGKRLARGWNGELDAARIRAAVEGLKSGNPEGMGHPTPAFTTGWNRALDSVLAIIDREDADARCPVHTFIALRDCDVHGPKAYREDA